MNLGRFLLRLSVGFFLFSIFSFPFLPESNNTKLFGDKYFVDPYQFIALMAFLSLIIYFVGMFFSRYHYKLAILVSIVFTVLGVVTILQNVIR